MTTASASLKSLLRRREGVLIYCQPTGDARKGQSPCVTPARCCTPDRSRRVARHHRTRTRDPGGLGRRPSDPLTERRSAPEAPWASCHQVVGCASDLAGGAFRTRPGERNGRDHSSGHRHPPCTSCRHVLDYSNAPGSRSIRSSPTRRLNSSSSICPERYASRSSWRGWPNATRYSATERCSASACARSRDSANAGM